jgi:hypothetical protein
MWITFTQRHKVMQGDGNGPLYEAGKSYEFKGPIPETYARKYIARGYAVEGRPKVEIETAPTPAPVAAEKMVAEKPRGRILGLGGGAAAAPNSDLLSGAADK